MYFYYMYYLLHFYVSFMDVCAQTARYYVLPLLSLGWAFFLHTYPIELYVPPIFGSARVCETMCECMNVCLSGGMSLRACVFQIMSAFVLFSAKVRECVRRYVFKSVCEGTCLRACAKVRV